jgi:hypothetical protein
VVPATVHGGTYSVRLRLRPGDSSNVAGYHVYVQPEGSGAGEAYDIGTPPSDAEGYLAVVVPGLDVRTTYVLAASTYAPGGTESPLSNTLIVGYRDAAHLVDSDHDGLTDGAEDKNLNQLVDHGETDPENPDTDEDGVLDGGDWCQETSAGLAVDTSGCPYCRSLELVEFRARIGSKRTRLTVRTVSASASDLDVTDSGIVLELVDDTQARLYRTEVTPSALAEARSRRLVRLREPRSADGGPLEHRLRRLLLKRRKEDLLITARGVMQRPGDSLTAAPVTWVVRAGDACVRTPPMTCRVSGARARCQ